MFNGGRMFPYSLSSDCIDKKSPFRVHSICTSDKRILIPLFFISVIDQALSLRIHLLNSRQKLCLHLINVLYQIFPFRIHVTICSIYYSLLCICHSLKTFYENSFCNLRIYIYFLFHFYMINQ